MLNLALTLSAFSAKYKYKRVLGHVISFLGGYSSRSVQSPRVRGSFLSTVKTRFPTLATVTYLHPEGEMEAWDEESRLVFTESKGSKVILPRAE